MQMPLKGECLKRQSFQCTLLESNFLWEGFSRFSHEYKERPQKLVQGDPTMYQTKNRIWFYPCDVGTKNERVTGFQNERIPTLNMVQAMTSQASGIRCSYMVLCLLCWASGFRWVLFFLVVFLFLTFRMEICTLCHFTLKEHNLSFYFNGMSQLKDYPESQRTL